MTAPRSLKAYHKITRQLHYIFIYFFFKFNKEEIIGLFFIFVLFDFDFKIFMFIQFIHTVAPSSLPGLKPEAHMYVLAMVLIFSIPLYFGFKSS